MSSNSPFASSSNPFAALRDEAPVSARNSVIAAGPAVDSALVETGEAAVEVMIRWEESILAIQHLTPARAYFVGEEGCDHVIPSDKLGAVKAPLVVVEGGETYAVVLPQSKAKITVGGRTLTLEDAIAEKLAVDCSAMSGAKMVKLSLNTRVRIELNGFVFETAGVNAGRKVAGKLGGDRKAFGAQALSLLLHGAVAASLFAFMPALASTEDGDMSNEQKYELKMALQSASKPEMEQEMPKSDETAPTAGEAAPGATKSDASKGPAGIAGKDGAPNVARRMSVKGSAQAYTFDRKSAMEDAVNFGMIGLLASNDGTNTPSSPWSTTSADGPDSENHNGNFWSNELGDSNGTGLSMYGGGNGAGGKGEGIDVGNLGTFMGGNGFCTGVNCKQGPGGPNGGVVPGTHKTTAPKLTPNAVAVSGRLPAEAIQRVVRQNFGRFRACYEAGLRTNPNLAGRVSVGFVIGTDGAVGSANNAGSDLSDGAVVSCIVGSFRGLSFSAPEGGIVKVTYGISLTPGS